MALEIREYRDDDLALLYQAVTKLQEYLIEIDPLHRLRMMPGYEHVQVEMILSDVARQHGAIFIAERNGAFVGMVTGFVVEQSGASRLGLVDARTGIISELFVVVHARGEGVGRALLLAMESMLEARGCDAIWLSTSAFNTNARLFYENQGYSEREVQYLKVLRPIR
ncbi:MAG TPA: GNAT family N-acetyltransferase [Magnetospirillaceae bacterium]|nr:GNAT family N-acetyltransferase [Magnetospirillaceae bacterium]